MPSSSEDQWINDQLSSGPISELEDTTIAVDASYYLQTFMQNPPYQEPLLPALGGLTGIHSHIETDLDNWKEHKVTPFFIFDGLCVVGYDEVAVQRAKEAVKGTDQAWELYFASHANEAVAAFGSHKGAYSVRNLFPMLQAILKRRGLHFKVPPVNAAAQIAYLDMIDSSQCSAIMGSQELLLYPVADLIIRSIDWDAGTLTGIYKKLIIKNLGVNESMFVDALLMTGTSFLPTFPPLKSLDDNIASRPPPTVLGAVNMLRTQEKSVAYACNNLFADELEKTDPNWFQKYRTARMIVDHFIYIAETGEIKVHNYETLTKDNYQYLGYQLPAELFHYLDSGLVGGRLLSWISYGQITIFPTLDGVVSDHYKHLVTEQLMGLRELALYLVLPRIHRGVQYKNITVKNWYDEKYSHEIQYRPKDPDALKAIQQAHSWNVSQEDLSKHFPSAKHGSILFELTSLKNPDFAQATVCTTKIKNIATGDLILSIALWRFLHLRGYVNDKHQLTAWGQALASSLETLESTVAKYPAVTGLFEAVLLAYELLRFNLLNARNPQEKLAGLPMNGSEDDKASLLLVSRCAIPLKLRHQANGYTGPLSKNFLCYRSLSSSIRQADRDLIEAIAASLFLHAQASRERDDYFQIGQSLPFLMDTDVALGIAVKTFLDETPSNEPAEQMAARKKEFAGKYVPYATHFSEDLDIACEFFSALHAGVKTLTQDVSNDDRTVWDKAAKYLAVRR